MRICRLTFPNDFQVAELSHKKLFSHFSPSIFEIFYMDVKKSSEIYLIHIELYIQFYQMDFDLVKVMKS